MHFSCYFQAATKVGTLAAANAAAATTTTTAAATAAAEEEGSETKLLSEGEEKCSNTSAGQATTSKVELESLVTPASGDGDGEEVLLSELKKRRRRRSSGCSNNNSSSSSQSYFEPLVEQLFQETRENTQKMEACFKAFDKDE